MADRYPEHEKTGHSDFDKIVEFAEFLKDQDWIICTKIKEHGLHLGPRVVNTINPRKAVNKFFEIDEEKLEKERLKMLEDE